MVERAVLHVGTMKSATTHVQATCDANTEALADQGFLWPGSRLNFAAFSDRFGGDRRSPEDGGWSDLVALMASTSGAALVSNELLSVRRAPALRPVVAELPHPVEVVITARDLVRVIPSQWRTGKENHRPTPWAEFIDALTGEESEHPAVQWFWRRQDLGAIIRAWSRLLGRQAVTLVTVPQAGADADVVLRRFFDVVGVDADPIAFPPRRPSRTATAADPVALSPAQRGWATARAEVMIADVLETGVRVVGGLDELRPPPLAG